MSRQIDRERGRSPIVFVYHDRAATYRELIGARFPDLEVVTGNDPVALERHLPDAEIVVASRFPHEKLHDARRLRWVQTTSAGVDFLVPGRAAIGGLLVTNTSGIHGSLMADYTMGAITMLQWDFRSLLQDQAKRRWGIRYVAPLAERSVGIVGLGAIGGAIARRAAAAGMRVLGVRRSSEPAEGVERIFPPDRLLEFLPLCDFVVLVVPATRETACMIGARELSAMKPGAFLVNIARGSVVDEPALVAALESGTIAGAFLDVFATEPLPADSRLWSLENVIVTPHISGSLSAYEDAAGGILVENLRRYLAGEELRNRVDLERGY